MTEEELLEQERMDKEVYDSTRSMFEFLMARMIEKIQMGEDHSADRKALLNAYNSASEGNQRLVSKIRRLEKSK